MKRTPKISLLLTIIGLMFVASTSDAQVTATATVTLTVIAAPAMNFSPTQSSSNSMAVSNSMLPSTQGITLQSSSNVLVQLNSFNSGENTQINFQDGESKTITAKDLRNVRSVEIVYLGS